MGYIPRRSGRYEIAKEASMMNIVEKRERTQDELKENTISLKWNHGNIALPLVFLRSSLFSANRRSNEWNEKTKRKIDSLSNITLFAQGPRLDQYDRLVYCSILQIAWNNNYPSTNGEKFLKYADFSFKVSDALRIISGEKGKFSTGRALAFYESLLRLSSVTVDLRQTANTSYRGNLLQFDVTSQKSSDKVGGRTIITVHLNPSLGRLFADGARGELRWDVLRALGKNQLASWIYGFVCTHEHTGNKSAILYSQETLVKLLGLRTENNRAVHPQLMRAFKELDEILRSLPIDPLGFDYQSKVRTDERLRKRYNYMIGLTRTKKRRSVNNVSIDKKSEEEITSELSTCIGAPSIEKTSVPDTSRSNPNVGDNNPGGDGTTETNGDEELDSYDLVVRQWRIDPNDPRPLNPLPF